MGARPAAAAVVREPVADGFDVFRARVSSAVVALDVHAQDPDRFTGRLDAVTAGDLHAFDITADAHTVLRTPALVARSQQQSCLKFTVLNAGGCLVVQDGRETTLAPGDMAVYDTTRPYSLLFDGPVQLSVVMFPRELLDVSADLLRHLTAVRLDGRTGVGSLVRPYVSALAREVDGAAPRVARRLLGTAVDLVGTLLEASVPGEVAQDPHGRLVREVLDYIEVNLSRADLDPAGIAAAHYISVRHLQGLFSERGTTVSAVVRTRRLERCYDDLVNPLLVGRSVNAIALEHGFTDAAHFSRTFRARFGLPPSAVRPARR